MIPFVAKNMWGRMAYDELDELLAGLARERTVIDHNELMTHVRASTTSLRTTPRLTSCTQTSGACEVGSA